MAECNQHIRFQEENNRVKSEYAVENESQKHCCILLSIGSISTTCLCRMYNGKKLLVHLLKIERGLLAAQTGTGS